MIRQVTLKLLSRLKQAYPKQTLKNENKSRILCYIIVCDPKNEKPLKMKSFHEL